MKIISSEQIIPCDIDGTILIWGHIGQTLKQVQFYDPYEGCFKSVGVNEANLKVLKDRLTRGATVFAWSASGFEWAASAMRAIKLEHKNLIICSKPVGYIDDKPCQDWMGPQIFLQPDDRWGQS